MNIAKIKFLDKTKNYKNNRFEIYQVLNFRRMMCEKMKINY